MNLRSFALRRAQDDIKNITKENEFFMSQEEITIIEPHKYFDPLIFKEIWQYRELLYFFAWRDFKVRYKQTALGVAWAVFQPLMAMIIFTVFFNKLAGIQSDNIPYPVFVYVGLLFWQFFSGALTDISNCLVNNQTVITKVYFPRLLLPIAATATKFIDFLIASIILIPLMIYYGYYAAFVWLADFTIYWFL